MRRGQGSGTFESLRRRVTAILALALVHTTAWAGGPTRMIHIVVQLSGTDIPTDSFAARPKIYWRASDRYCRVDEELDREHGIHGRIIANEPDVWLINLEDKTARHVLDHGPTPHCRLPIFTTDPEIARSRLAGLEFGRELQFFQANGAKIVNGPKLRFEARYYEVSIDDFVLTLVERVDVHAPVLIGLMHGGKSYKVGYLAWDDQLLFKADLFAKPSDMKIEEGR